MTRTKLAKTVSAQPSSPFRYSLKSGQVVKLVIENTIALSSVISQLTSFAGFVEMQATWLETAQIGSVVRIGVMMLQEVLCRLVVRLQDVLVVEMP